MNRWHAIALMLLVTLCQPAAAASFPMDCLEQKLIDYPNTTNDLYMATVQYGPNCNDDYEDELWSGTPTAGAAPQTCPTCEPSDALRGLPVSGHGMTLVESNAWDQIKKSLDTSIAVGSVPSKFYKISADSKVGIDRDLYFMAIPIKIANGPHAGQTRYFGLETDNVADFTQVTTKSARTGPGAQMEMHATVGTEIWPVLIWLK
jgi:hypothetical protein